MIPSSSLLPTGGPRQHPDHPQPFISHPANPSAPTPSCPGEPPGTSTRHPVAGPASSPPAPSPRGGSRGGYLAAPGLLGAQVPLCPGVPVPPAARRRALTQVSGDVGPPLARPPSGALGGLLGAALLGCPGVGHLPHPHDVLRGPVLLVHAGCAPEGAQPLHLRRHHRVAPRALLPDRPVNLDGLRRPRGTSAVAGDGRRAGGSPVGWWENRTTGR